MLYEVLGAKKNHVFRQIGFENILLRPTRYLSLERDLEFLMILRARITASLTLGLSDSAVSMQTWQMTIFPGNTSFVETVPQLVSTLPFYPQCRVVLPRNGRFQGGWGALSMNEIPTWR